MVRLRRGGDNHPPGLNAYGAAQADPNAVLGCRFAWLNLSLIICRLVFIVADKYCVPRLSEPRSLVTYANARDGAPH